MKLLFAQFSPRSCHFLPVTFKYSPQHPVLVPLILCSPLTLSCHVSQ
jgi:hypothetical protein